MPAAPATLASLRVDVDRIAAYTVYHGPQLLVIRALSSADVPVLLAIADDHHARVIRQGRYFAAISVGDGMAEIVSTMPMSHIATAIAELTVTGQPCTPANVVDWLQDGEPGTLPHATSAAAQVLATLIADMARDPKRAVDFGDQPMSLVDIACSIIATEPGLLATAQALAS